MEEEKRQIRRTKKKKKTCGVDGKRKIRSNGMCRNNRGRNKTERKRRHETKKERGGVSPFVFRGGEILREKGGDFTIKAHQERGRLRARPL